MIAENIQNDLLNHKKSLVDKNNTLNVKLNAIFKNFITQSFKIIDEKNYFLFEIEKFEKNFKYKVIKCACVLVTRMINSCVCFAKFSADEHVRIEDNSKY